MFSRIIYSVIFINSYFQVSPSFSLLRCLPSGWEILLLSCIITLVSERVLLDKENFWQTLPAHLAIGFTCFCISSIVMLLRKSKNEVVPENKDDGDSDEDKEDDDEQDGEDQEEDDAAEGDPSGDENAEGMCNIL
ncbi:uncharacterized protein LOC141825299 isoform X2 [Curcuma longa]